MKCEKCGEEYDEHFRLDECPHLEFSMHAIVTRSDGTHKTVYSPAELFEFLSGEEEK